MRKAVAIEDFSFLFDAFRRPNYSFMRMSNKLKHIHFIFNTVFCLFLFFSFNFLSFAIYNLYSNFGRDCRSFWLSSNQWSRKVFSSVHNTPFGIRKKILETIPAKFSWFCSHSSRIWNYYQLFLVTSFYGPHLRECEWPKQTKKKPRKL